MRKINKLNASNVPYYLDDIEMSFVVFLQKDGASVKTRKNYKSDVRHFLRWFNRPIKSITPTHINEYKKYFSSNTPQATLNRRLSTMRTFFSFCLESGLIATNPSRTITNVSKPFNTKTLLEDFAYDLQNEGASKATVKNYVSDVRQFFAWFSRYAA